MSRTKQDWSPRGMTIDACYVTLEYDKLHTDFPGVQDSLDLLIHDSDPENLIEEDGISPSKAQREARKFHKLVEAFRRKEWWYVRLFAHTLVPSLAPGDKHMVRVATSGDIIESNWPPRAIWFAEQSELNLLQNALEDRGYNCRKFHVLRLGSFALQHPQAPKSEGFTVPRVPFSPRETY